MSSEIAADVEFHRRAAYLPAADALVLADLHVGRDAASNVELPLGERSDLTDRLAALLDRVSPATVVFAGDLLHAFDRLPRGVEETVEALRDAVLDAGATPVAVAGNHDAMLDSVWPGSTAATHRLGDGTVVLHGHEAPAADAERYVLGHEHPAITIEGRRHPCALVGRSTYRGADVLVLPAFTRLAPGVDVGGLRADDANAPVLSEGSLDDYRPVVVADGERFAFPPLGEFRRML